MFERGVALLTPTLTGVILSDTEPGFADRDKVWVRTSAGAPVSPAIWTFWNGLWVAKHPVAAGTLWALPYTGSVASIATLDGGSNVAVTANTGPFWEEVTTLQARMPIGAGTLPSGTILAVGDTGGEEKHVLIPAEGGFYLPVDAPHLDDGDAQLGNLKSLRSFVMDGHECGAIDAIGTPSAPFTLGSQTPTAHNTLPPYTTLTFLRRTARQFCTQPIS